MPAILGRCRLPSSQSATKWKNTLTACQPAPSDAGSRCVLEAAQKKAGSRSNGGQVVFAAERGRVVERRRSLLLLMEGGYGDCFLDVCQTGNLINGSFELSQRYVLLTAEPLKKGSPNRIKVIKPPTWCLFLPFPVPHDG